MYRWDPIGRYGGLFVIAHTLLGICPTGIEPRTSRSCTQFLLGNSIALLIDIPVLRLTRVQASAEDSALY
jgi:hypothetical protein